MRSPSSRSPVDGTLGAPQKAPAAFRDHQADARRSVRELYRLQHRNQTYEFVQAKRQEYLTLDRRRMGIWEAMEFLDRLVDDSDGDPSVSRAVGQDREVVS